MTAPSVAKILGLASFALLGAASLRSKPIGLLERIYLNPVPLALTSQGEKTPFPGAISVAGLSELDPAQEGTVETMRELFRQIPAVRCDLNGSSAYRVEFARNPAITQAEGYSLTSSASGIRIEAGTAAGEFYGAQTVYQLLAYAYYGTQMLAFSEVPAEPDAAQRRYIPSLKIEDHPAYAVRSVMLDLGRAPYSKALLQRAIRIMGQLKLNTLHLHLYDDQLCSFRFAHLALGHENPLALGAADLRELVRYARVRHISVMPELESWGHVQSIVAHYPETFGTAGVYAGASFGVGTKTYDLLERIYDEIVPCLEDTAAVHVGLDEANWALLPGAENRDETPTKMVGRIYQILMRVGDKYHKHLTMHLWADHGGRPLPAELDGKVVVEPWKYLGSDAPEIVKALAQYGGAGKTPFMMAGGASSQSIHGTYEATRVWCTEGLKYPNALGVTLCVWESNDLGGRLITLYGGADYAWAPSRAPKLGKDPLGEKLRYRLDHQMQTWQLLFPDANPAAIDADRGPEVQGGHYAWPPFAPASVRPE